MLNEQKKPQHIQPSKTKVLKQLSGDGEEHLPQVTPLSSKHLSVITFSQLKQRKSNQFYREPSIPNFQFEAIDGSDNSYLFDAKDWNYFSKGADHIVFRNINPESNMHSKVLIFKRKKMTKLDEQIMQHYLQDLENSGAYAHVNKGVKLYPKTKQSEKVLSLLKEKKEQIQFSTTVFTLQDNVFHNPTKYWDVMLQFKPKSLMPSKYGRETIDEIASDYQVDPELFVDQIGKADVIEKLTWFKKVACSGKKMEISPLQVFAGISYDCNNLDFTKTQFFKQYHQTIEIANLNRLILQQLRKSTVLQEIHRVTSCYGLPNLYGVEPELAQASQLPVTLPLVVSTSTELFPISSTQKFLEKQTCMQASNQEYYLAQDLQTKWSTMYRLLVFRAWNDVSITIKLKLSTDSTEVTDSEIKILDYEPWLTKTVEKRSSSEKEYLRRYLEWKGIIKSYVGPPMRCSNKIKLRAFKNQTNQQKCYLQITQYEEFIGIFKQGLSFDSIRYLYADKINLGLDQVRSLVRCNLKNLQILSLCSNNLNESCARSLSLGNWPALRILNLNGNKVKNQGLMHLSQSNWDSLTEICLEWNQINENALQYIGRWTKLNRLGLSCCKIGPKGVQALASFKQPELRQVNLYNNMLQADGLAELARCEWPNLQVLHLGRNHLVKESFTEDLFAKWPHLKALDLSINPQIPFNSDIFPKLRLENIRHLKLCYNRINHQGVLMLNKVQFTCLKTLDLYLNRLRDPGIDALCQRAWPDLQELNLTRNKVSDYGAQLFQAGRFPRLRRLVLYHNSITLVGVRHLLLHNWTGLSTIDLAENGISHTEFHRKGQQLGAGATVPVSCVRIA